MAYKSAFVRSNLSSAFGILGHSIGRHPFIYFFIPVIITALLSIGFYWINLIKDVEYLYSPDGRALKEREAVESIFPLSSDNMDITSSTRIRGMTLILLIPKDNLSIFRENIIEDAIKIDKIIYNISISWKDRTLTFRDLCLKTILGNCQSNDVLNLRGSIRNIRTKRFLIRYPMNMEKMSQHLSLYGLGLGGVTLDSNNYVVDALALRLCYILDFETSEKIEMGLKWETSFLETLSRTTLKNVRIFRANSLSVDNEVNRVTELVVPLLIIVFPTMVMFSVITTVTSDCITSKPWIAIASCISPMFGVISAFGILMFSGVQYQDINIAILFLLSGIGLDDSFVMLASWRRTDPKLRVEERMSQTYSEAAVSITITSITNCLSLCIGLTSPYRVTQIYCTYAALSIFLAYIYQITFFGGALTLSGMREHKGLHSILCFNIKDKKVGNSSPLDFFCIGCAKQKGGNIKGKTSPNSRCTNFFLSLILTTKGKIMVIGCFLLYITSSFYSLKFIKKEFNFKDVMPYHSYIIEYLDMYDKYFRKHDHAVHLVINETLDYSSRQVQNNINDILDTFSKGPNMAGRSMCYSWLDYYLQSASNKRLWLLYNGYNVSDTDDFVSALRDVFLKFHSGRHFRQHIKFNENKTKIVSSRFILFTKDIDSANKETQLLSTLWNTADSSIYDVYVHSMWFPLMNIMTEIETSFINTFIIAIILVIAVFFIIICDILYTVNVFLITLSIQCGVIGFMSLWNVPISPISMICIVISIGLSVDYAAHISYTYLSCEESNPDEKTRVALLSTGYPIIQGCVSTLIGAGILFFGPSNILLVFAKVMTLVMLISLFHGIIVIPVIFNILDLFWNKIFCRLKKHK